MRNDEDELLFEIEVDAIRTESGPNAPLRVTF
jgi:hypothetical protein